MASYEVAVRIRPAHCLTCCSMCSVCAVHRFFPGNSIGDSVVAGLESTEGVVLQCHSLTQ